MCWYSAFFYMFVKQIDQVGLNGRIKHLGGGKKLKTTVLLGGDLTARPETQR